MTKADNPQKEEIHHPHVEHSPHCGNEYEKRIVQNHLLCFGSPLLRADSSNHPIDKISTKEIAKDETQLEEYPLQYEASTEYVKIGSKGG